MSRKKKFESDNKLNTYRNKRGPIRYISNGTEHSILSEAGEILFKNHIKEISDEENTPSVKHSSHTNINSFEDAYENYSKNENITVHSALKTRTNKKIMSEFNEFMYNNTNFPDYMKLEENQCDDRGLIRSFSTFVISSKLLDDFNDEEVTYKPELRRYNSFETELLDAHEYEDIPKKNNSCILDRILPSTVKKPIMMKRSNSIESKINLYDAEDDNER